MRRREFIALIGGAASLEPDLVNKIAAGRRGRVSCVSCNICFLHEGIEPLRCWRTPTAMLTHIYKHYLRDKIRT